MPEPLQYRRAEPAPLFVQLLIGLSFVVPPIALVVLWLRGGVLALESHAANVLAHGFTLLVPLAWASLLLQPIRFRPTSERTIGRTSFFSELGGSWWMSALMWPAPLLALALLAQRMVEILGAAGPPLRSTPGDVLLLWLTATVLLTIWVTSFREQAEIRLSDEGLRGGNLHFTEWTRLDRVVRRGTRFDVCHAVNPGLPFSCFRLDDPEARAVFLEALARRSIRVVRSHSAVFLVLRLLIALAVVAQLAAGLALQAWLGSRSHNRLWSVVIIFLVGLGLMILLERYRGIRHITRLKPQLEPPVPENPDAASGGDGPEGDQGPEEEGQKGA